MSLSNPPSALKEAETREECHFWHKGRSHYRGLLIPFRATASSCETEESAFLWCSPEQDWYGKNIYSLLGDPNANSLARKSRFLWGFFFPSAAVGVSVKVSSEVTSGYMRKKTKITNRETCFNTRKFLQSYEPSQTTFITSRFRAFCQFCEFFPIFYFFFMCL